MIAILDYGSQFSHLIGRRIRSLRVYAEIFPNTTTADGLENREVEGIILVLLNQFLICAINNPLHL